MVLLLVLLTYTAGCLDDEGDDDNGDDEPEEVLANAGTNVVGVVGEPVTFNASASSGPIVRYTWGITVNATSPNITVLEGVEAEYTFNEAGKYLVTLTIVGDKDQNDSITIHAFIDLIKSISGTVTLTERNETYEYTVTDNVQAVRLTLTYDTQVEELDLSVPALLDHGGFRIVVRWTTAPTSEVSFDLDVEIMYSGI
jgi:PKD repeat protein